MKKLLDSIVCICFVAFILNATPAEAVLAGIFAILIFVQLSCVLSGLKDIQDELDVKRAYYRSGLIHKYKGKSHKCSLFGDEFEFPDDLS